MSSAVEYRELADECLGWARTAKSDNERRIFLQMAEAWLQRGLGPDGPPKTAEYLRFDEIEDVLSSMDLLALVVPLVDEQAGYWKWIIISAHAALQGAMVCVLAATASLAALEKKCTHASHPVPGTVAGVGGL